MATFSHDSAMRMVLNLNGFQSRFVHVDSCKIHYLQKRHPREKGLLVFVHGVGASAAHAFRVLNFLWKKGYSLIAIDLPSHGASGTPLAGLTSDVFFDLFSRALNLITSQKFILIGNSLGGGLSLRYAAENSQKLEKLILASPAGGFGTETEWEEFKSTLVFKSVADSKKYIPKIFHKPPLLIGLTYAPFYRSMSRASLRGLIKSTKFQDFVIEDRQLENLPPTLFIWGKSEKVFPQAHLTYFKAKLPAHVIFEEPEGIGHCPQFDNPRWFAQRIDHFAETI